MGRLVHKLMNMKIIKILVALHTLVFLSGCDKNEEKIFIKGNIVGFVNLIDERGNEVDDKSGINVSMEGISSSADTNEDGRFELTDVPVGTYNLLFDKPGYGVNKRFSYQFIGGNVPALLPATTMYEQPKTEIKSLDITFDNNMINILGKTTETDRYSFEIFINDSSDVSNLNYDYSTGRYSVCCSPMTQFSGSIYLSDTPYSAGKEVYLVIYFVNPHESMAYYDYNEEKYVFGSYKKVTDAIKLTLK